jgi:hypothetical protein
MTKRDDLFDLINIMSKSEKRYFKVSATQHTVKGKNKYVLLFDLINKQKVYNEKAIKLAITDKMLQKNFAVEKNYLYNFLLKTLTSFHGQKSLNAKASNSLYTISLLTSKALYNQSSKLIEKTIKFAEQSENFTLLLELLKLKIDYLEGVADNQKIQETYKRMFEIQNIQGNVMEYRYYHNLMYDLLSELGKTAKNEIIKKAEELLDNDLLKSEDNGLCNESKIKFNEIWVLYCYLKKDFKKGFSYSERSIEIIDSLPLFITEKQSIYISSLNNYIIFGTSIREFEKAYEKVGILKSLLTKDSTNRSNISIFSSTALIETHNFVATSQFEKIYDIIEELETGVELFGDKLFLSQKYGLFFNISTLFFINGDFNLALKWINKIIHFEEPKARTDMMGFAWVLNLLIHFELKNHDYLDYLMKSTHRYLANKNQLIITAKALMDAIKVQIKFSDKNKKDEAYLTCLKLIQSPECKNELGDAESFELQLWVKSKVEGRSFSSLIEEYNNSLG